jgi:hypothetical protein
MKRRAFLKLLGIAPFAPSVLAAKEKLLPKDPEIAIGQTHDWIFLGESADYTTIEVDYNLRFIGESACMGMPDVGSLYSEKFPNSPVRTWIYKGPIKGWMPYIKEESYENQS